MSRISFKQFISRQGKKDSRDGTFGGKGGLPSFSNTHPYFQGKLRIPHGGDDDRSEKEDCNPNNEYCYPWQNQGPNEGEIGSDPDNPDGGWGEYWQWLKDRQHGGDPTPPQRVCSNPPCLLDDEGNLEIQPPDQPRRPHNTSNTENRPPRPGPEGPTDDLWDTRKYRGVTNMNTPKSNRHSLYYTGE